MSRSGSRSGPPPSRQATGDSKSKRAAAVRPASGRVRGASKKGGNEEGRRSERSRRSDAAPPLRPVPVVPVVRKGPGTRSPAAPAPAPAAAMPGVPSAAAGASQKLQKVLAQAGLGSRREMEELIQAGKVLVNGATATLGMRVNPEDLVKVGRRQLRFKLSPRLPRVIIYHKPEGEIVSRDDPDGRPTAFARLPVIRSGKWLALGRLDFNTCGLLIFTTSGELANRMTHPKFEVEREYAVRIMGELTPEQMRTMREGVVLDDGPAQVDMLEEQGGTGLNRWYRVIVREGRNRLVRRLFEHFGHTVSRLMRVRFGIINLPPHLKRGQTLELTEAQTRSVLDWLAGGSEAAPPAEPPPAPPTERKRPRSRPAPAPRKRAKSSR